MREFRPIARRLAFTIAWVFVAACSPMPNEAEEQAAEQQRQIVVLRGEIQANRAAVEQARLDAAKPAADVNELEKTIALLASTANRLEQQLADLDSRLAKLERAAAPSPPPSPASSISEATETNVAPGRILPSRPPNVSVYSAPDRRLADFIETPSRDNLDLFPIQVTAVAGRKEITGTHDSTRIIESEQVSKDDYGRKIPLRKEVEQKVNEFAYEVSFSAQNLTRTEKIISYTAGAGTRVMTLQPGQVVDQIIVPSAVGSDLHVEVAGMLKRYHVAY